VRVPGRVVRRLVIRGVRVQRAHRSRLVLVAVTNSGTVTAQLRGSVTVSLYRHGKWVGRLRLLAPRPLPPGVSATVTLRYSGRVRGPVTALVTVRLGPGIPAVERRYRIRL
jgi:hypothetical protein